VTLVGHDDVGDARELRLTHYGRASVWDVTTGHLEKPTDRREFLGRPLGRDGVQRCLECHTTNAHSTRERAGPTANEVGIGCERCHGPSGNHLAAMAQKFPDPAIARPELASAEQVMAVCASCHSPKDLRIGPGDKLAPRFASNSLAWSRCYSESEGAFSCTTCHDPHKNAETSVSFYESRCLACHATQNGAPPRTREEGRRVAGRPENVLSKSCPVEPRQGCLKCHMPQVDDIVPHATFTDHYIRVHRTRPS
jgi:hypothetical protein